MTWSPLGNKPNEFTYFMMNLETIPEQDSQTFPTNTRKNPTDLDERLLLKMKYLLLPFSKTLVHCKTIETQIQGYKLHVMTHTLLNGVYMLKTYIELKDESQNLSVVLQNLTSKTIHLAPGRCVARVAAANEVLESMPALELMEKLNEALPMKATKLMIEEHQKLLMELLRENSGLE